jgi:hypothetical protein
MTTTTSTSTVAPGEGARQPARLSWAARTMAWLAAWRVWAVGAVVYAGFAWAFFASTAPFAIARVTEVCGQQPPDLRVGPGASEVHDFLATCGEPGREAYTAMQVADLFYPAVFAFFLASSLALTLRLIAPGRPRLLALAGIPVLAAAFDYLENVSAWLALSAFPEPGSADWLFAGASSAKNVTSWAAGLLLVGAVLALVGRRFGAMVARRRTRPHGGEWVRR